MQVERAAQCVEHEAQRAAVLLFGEGVVAQVEELSGGNAHCVGEVLVFGHGAAERGGQRADVLVQRRVDLRFGQPGVGGKGEARVRVDHVPRRQADVRFAFEVQRAFGARDVDGRRRVLVVGRGRAEQRRRTDAGGEDQPAERERQQNAAHALHDALPRRPRRVRCAGAGSAVFGSAFSGASGGATSMCTRIVVPFW